MSVQSGHLRRSNGFWYSIRRVIFQSLAVRFFGRAGPIRMHFDRDAVEPEAINGHADHVVFLKRIKQPVQNACICPTAHPGVNVVLLTKAWRQGTPFAAVLGNTEDGVDHRQV